MISEHTVHRLGVKRIGGSTKFGRKILLILEVETPVGRVVQIPRAGRELIEHIGLKRGEVAAGPLEAIDELIFAESVCRSWY